MDRKEKEIDISPEKVLGVVGSVLLLFSPFFYIGILFWIVGVVILSKAIKGISVKMEDERIFKDFLKGIIILSVGMILAGGWLSAFGIGLLFLFIGYILLAFAFLQLSDRYTIQYKT